MPESERRPLHAPQLEPRGRAQALRLRGVQVGRAAVAPVQLMAEADRLGWGRYEAGADGRF